VSGTGPIVSPEASSLVACRLKRSSRWLFVGNRVPGVSLVANAGVRIGEPSLIRVQRQPDGPGWRCLAPGSRFSRPPTCGPCGECGG
jgi:hypothetical protein